MENLLKFIHATPENDDYGLLDAYSKTITGVVGTVAEGVVHIEIKKNMRNKRTKEIIVQSGSGSGFVISSDGYIVTNAHVVENAIEIKVSFQMAEG